MTLTLLIRLAHMQFLLGFVSGSPTRSVVHAGFGYNDCKSGSCRMSQRQFGQGANRRAALLVDRRIPQVGCSQSGVGVGSWVQPARANLRSRPISTSLARAS